MFKLFPCALFSGKPGPNNWWRHLEHSFRAYDRPLHAYGMTTNEELCLLEIYARHGFTGAGKIVDLGCWFGATTLSLARGLALNQRAREHRRIEAFDLFVWEEWMNSSGPHYPPPKKYRAGESFFKDVSELLAPYSDTVRLYQHDLMAYSPPSEPIEFLFIDAMKSWPLADRIARCFFPLLSPGTSKLIQQDFAFYHPTVATNHLLMWRLREHFAWLYHCPGSSSVLFSCTRKFDADVLPTFTPESFSAEMIEEAYDYSLRCVRPESRVLLETAKLGFLIRRGFATPALAQLERVARLRKSLFLDLVTVIEAEALKRLAVATAEAGGSPDWVKAIQAWAQETKTGMQ